MIKKNIKELISGAVNSASMKETSIENKKLVEDEKLFKKKMIQLPVELDERIKKIYTGTCSSYILMAIHEKLKRDEL
ncbi:MAG: hypothetical protein K2Q03_08305 [Sphingobacteriaceae bacterium]|nr:hypothetical protein [Sphingobacteriaceae bacterium]